MDTIIQIILLYLSANGNYNSKGRPQDCDVEHSQQKAEEEGESWVRVTILDLQ